MADSTFVHRWLPGTNARTLLLLHGTGGNENDLIPLGQSLDPAANLLSLRGRVDEGGSNRFFRRFAEGDFDQDNMRQETEVLSTFLASASSQYGFDREQVIAVGFSNGANMAASLMFRHPESLSGGFLMRAMVPFEPDPGVALGGLRILIASGEFDPIVPRENVERLATFFVRGGADVEHLWIPIGHQLTRQEIEHAKGWLSPLSGVDAV